MEKKTRLCRKEITEYFDQRCIPVSINHVIPPEVPLFVTDSEAFYEFLIKVDPNIFEDIEVKDNLIQICFCDKVIAEVPKHNLKDIGLEKVR